MRCVLKKLAYFRERVNRGTEDIASYKQWETLTAPPHPKPIKLLPRASGNPGSPTSERPGWELDGHWLPRGSWEAPLGPMSEGFLLTPGGEAGTGFSKWDTFT